MPDDVAFAMNDLADRVLRLGRENAQLRQERDRYLEGLKLIIAYGGSVSATIARNALEIQLPIFEEDRADA